MTWWLKVAEEIAAMRRLRGEQNRPASGRGFIFDVPAMTIEGTARVVSPEVAPPASPELPVINAVAALPPPAPAEAAEPEAAAPQPAGPTRSSFLRGTERYKLRWEIRPTEMRKTASK